MQAKLLRIHVAESDRYHGKPLHEAIVDRCRELGIAGATVLRGLEGFGGTADIHRSHLTAGDQPAVIVIVDSAVNVERLIPAVEEMMGAGLMALSDVDIVRVQKKTQPSV